MLEPRRRLNVLVVTAWSPMRPGDADSLVLAHHLRELAPHHDVTVLSADSWEGRDTVAGPLPESITLRGFGAEALGTADGVARRVRGLLRGVPAHVLWVQRPALMDAYREALAGSPRPDVVYLFAWGTAQLAQEAAAAGAPVVHMAVDGWSHGFANRALPGWRSLLDVGQSWAVRRHEAAHYPRCAAVAVVAPAEAERLSAQVPAARVDVVVNGVDVSHEISYGPRGDVIAFHGDYSTRPNQEAATVAASTVIPLVRRRRPDAELHLIGRKVGPEVAALAGPGVRVVGEVEDVARALSAARAYVAPMISGAGIKNKVLEALACGLPVAATTRASDGIEPGPGLVVEDDPAALAEVLVGWLEAPDDAAALGEAARERITSLQSWQHSARTLEQLWLRAAASR